MEAIDSLGVAFCPNNRYLLTLFSAFPENFLLPYSSSMDILLQATYFGTSQREQFSILSESIAIANLSCLFDDSDEVVVDSIFNRRANLLFAESYSIFRHIISSRICPILVDICS